MVLRTRYNSSLVRVFCPQRRLLEYSTLSKIALQSSRIDSSGYTYPEASYITRTRSPRVIVVSVFQEVASNRYSISGGFTKILHSYYILSHLNTTLAEPESSLQMCILRS